MTTIAKVRNKGSYQDRQEIYRLIRERQEFRNSTGSFRGERSRWNMVGYWPEGRLDPKYRDSLGRASYVIYSYGTPIAWFDTKYRATPTSITVARWVIPDESYSVTTSQHQGICRVACAE